MATIARRRALTDLPGGTPSCPAALVIAGSTPGRCGVVCRVIAQDRQREDGVGINAAQLATAREGGDGDTFLTIEKDPGSVERLCFGAGVPVPDSRGHYGDGDGGMRRSYTFCPIWQAEKLRIEQGREQLAGGGVVTPPEQEPTVERVSHGVPEPVAPIAMDDGDPWASARRDLDAVAPPADATSDAYGPLSQRG